MGETNEDREPADHEIVVSWAESIRIMVEGLRMCTVLRHSPDVSDAERETFEKVQTAIASRIVLELSPVMAAMKNKESAGGEETRLN